MPHNNQVLAKEAEAAFGERWRRPLAKAMGVKHTQVMRWALGYYEISDANLLLAKEACQKHKFTIMARFRSVKVEQE